MRGKIFNTQEVRAIIAGRKTMFREVAKPPRHEFLTDDCVLKGQIVPSKKVKGFQVYFQEPKNKWFAEDKPTGIIVKSKLEVGQEIFVKGQESSITLRITSVKVERLRDISNDDAIAEAPQYRVIDPFGNATPIDLFKILWNYTHKKPEEKWEVDPWVFVYEFEVINFKK